jgi:choline-sulfatase
MNSARHRVLAYLIAGGIVLPLPSCGPDRGAKAPDVVLVTIDTMRADRAGCYGYPDAHTPLLDRLARGGVSYEQCLTSIPITLPSHASILSGQTPPEHGVRNNGTYRLSPNVPTLAGELSARGYATGAFVAALPLVARFGLTSGFDVYDDELPTDDVDRFQLIPERPAGDVVASALRWVRAQSSDAPLFVWVHLFEPHNPYAPPPPLDHRYRTRPYDGEVAVADRATKKLLDGFTAARSRKRLTVVTSDHGEGLGDHGEVSHALFIFDATLCVPLVFRFPDHVPAEALVQEPVALVDIAPTVLSLVGADPKPLLHGQNILLKPGRENPPRRSLYAETLHPLEGLGWSPAFALREGSRKVIRSARLRAYSLAEDPGELHNLMEHAHPSWADTLLASLDSTLTALTKPQDSETAMEPTPEELEALAALGYVGGVRAEDDAQSLLRATRERPDMEDKMPAFDMINAAANALDAGRVDAAITTLRALLATDPHSSWAQILLGEALVKTGQREAALRSFQAADRLQPNRLGTVLNTARLLRETGREDEALAAYDHVLELTPGSNRSLIMEAAEYRAMRGDGNGGRQILENALTQAWDPPGGALLREALERIERFTRPAPASSRQGAGASLPGTAQAAVLQARYLQWQGRWEEALAVLSSSDFDDVAEVHLYRGVAQHRLGDANGAAASFAHAVQLDSSLHLAHNNLAWLLATSFGRAEEALPQAQQAIALCPHEPEYHDTYVEVLERLGRREQARRHLTQILPEFPQHAGLRERAKQYGIPLQ